MTATVVRAGPGQALCSACGRLFRGVSLFEQHRQGVGAGPCTDPTTLGMTEVDRLWTTPAGHAQRSALADRLAAHRTPEETS